MLVISAGRDISEPCPRSLVPYVFVAGLSKHHYLVREVRARNFFQERLDNGSIEGFDGCVHLINGNSQRREGNEPNTQRCDGDEGHGHDGETRCGIEVNIFQEPSIHRINHERALYTQWP